MGDELTTLLESAKGMKEMSWIGEESNGARAPSPKAPKRKMKTKQTTQGKSGIGDRPSYQCSSTLNSGAWATFMLKILVYVLNPSKPFFTDCNGATPTVLAGWVNKEKSNTGRITLPRKFGTHAWFQGSDLD